MPIRKILVKIGAQGIFSLREEKSGCTSGEKAVECRRIFDRAQLSRGWEEVRPGRPNLSSRWFAHLLAFRIADEG